MYIHNWIYTQITHNALPIKKTSTNCQHNKVVVSSIFPLSSLPGNMIQFDEHIFFSDGLIETHQVVL